MRYIRPPRPGPCIPCFAPPAAPRRILRVTPPEATATTFAATPVALTRVGISPRAGHLCTRCAPPRGTRRRARSAPTTPDFPCDGGPSITHLLPPLSHHSHPHTLRIPTVLRLYYLSPGTLTSLERRDPTRMCLPSTNSVRAVYLVCGSNKTIIVSRV